MKKVLADIAKRREGDGKQLAHMSDGVANAQENRSRTLAAQSAAQSAYDSARNAYNTQNSREMHEDGPEADEGAQTVSEPHADAKPLDDVEGAQHRQNVSSAR